MAAGPPVHTLLEEQEERGGELYYNKVEICGINTAKLPVLREK